MSETVLTVEQLVTAVSLESIEIDHLAAERSHGAPADEPLDVKPDYTLSVELRDDLCGFRVRLLTEITVPVGSIRCGVYAEYELQDAQVGSDSTEAIGDFINGVALMHLLPYVRQAIADITMRVFNGPLLMPIIQRGEIGFQVDLNPSSVFPEPH